MNPQNRKNLHDFAIGAAGAALCLLLAGSLPAEARTTLQLETGETLSFEDGSIDMTTGSGELYDVTVAEGDDVLLRADYLSIDASGTVGGIDWFVHDLVADNAEMPYEGLFIGRLELEDIAFGRLVEDEGMADYEQYITADTRVSLENIGMVAEDALFSVDRVVSLPFSFGQLNAGLQIVTSAGFEVENLTAMPLDESAPGENPILDKLAERGVTDIGMDLRLATGASLNGDSIQLFYGIEGGVRDLAASRFSIAFSTTQDAYSQLIPLLMDPEENGAALLGLSGVMALDGAEFAIGDNGLMDILFEIAAEEEGISDGDARTIARIGIASVLQESFPENAPRLLPPIEAFISRGGRLDIAAAPQTPVPLSSSLGFMMLPDLAIDQLGISVEHTP